LEVEDCLRAQSLKLSSAKPERMMLIMNMSKD